MAWLVLNSAKILSTNSISVRDYELRWGQAQSEMDKEEDFDFGSEFSNKCLAVFLTLKGDYRAILNVTSVNQGGFTVNRDNIIDSKPVFNYLAIGR